MSVQGFTSDAAARARWALRPIDPVSFDGRAIPERPWLVPGLIPMRQVTEISGDGGIGKTLLELQLMVACTIGRPWLGHAAHRCKCVGFFAEDDKDELHRRLSDIVTAEGATLGDLEGLTLFDRTETENELVVFDRNEWSLKPTDLWSHLVNFTVNEGAELLIIDTRADVFAGSEIDRVQVRKFVSMLRHLAKEMNGGNGGTVILSSHPSAEGRRSGSGESGSTAWHNSVRSRLFLERVQDDQDARMLTNKKLNYGASGAEIRIRWDAGRFVAESKSGGFVGVLDRRAQERRVDETFIAALRALNLQGRQVSDKPCPTYAPKVLSKMEACAGIGKQALEASMYRLFQAGVIRTEETGPASKRRERIVLVEQVEGSK